MKAMQQTVRTDTHIVVRGQIEAYGKIHRPGDRVDVYSHPAWKPTTIQWYEKTQQIMPLPLGTPQEEEEKRIIRGKALLDIKAAELKADRERLPEASKRREIADRAKLASDAALADRAAIIKEQVEAERAEQGIVERVRDLEADVAALRGALGRVAA
jgi:hypothetical protein